MFSGLIEGFTTVSNLEIGTENSKFTFCRNNFLDDLQIGDSVAINGVCLTVTELSTDTFCVELMPETLRVSTLSSLCVGGVVNVERALLAQSRIGGHFVLGHVDTKTSIVSIHPEGNAKIVSFSSSPKFLPYLVPKGQIAIDGMSLTIMKVEMDYFTVGLIPHTQKITIAKNYQINTEVNLEFDILAKYAQRKEGLYEPY